MPAVTVEVRYDIARVTIDNPPVNATSTAVRRGLLDALEEVRGARLAVLGCAGRTFVAGGDMSEFDRPAEEPHLPDVVNAIEACPTPFVALLHGTVLGGGLEIAMACGWRIAAPGTRLGLPEVNVGLIPGAGGTQRAPRLFGWEAAVDMACSGRMLSAAEALELGAVDAVTDDFDTAIAALPTTPPPPVSKRTAPPLDPDWLASKREALERRARGQQSPLLNLEALSWATRPFATSQPRERTLHLDLRCSDESKALRYAFFAERAAARPSVISGATPREIGTIAVVGGGLMGTGIAAACLGAGLHVTLIERDNAAATTAQSRVLGLLDGALKRGRINEAAHTRQRLAFSATAEVLTAQAADLAIEAVFEDVAVKAGVIDTLAAVMRPDAILATNTSYLDPRAIFAAIENPARCIGLHFFSPAHVMKLLEIVRLPQTSADTLATGFALARRLGKVGVLAGICDGFIGNRMLAAYRRAAEYLLADGATPARIDAAMKGFGMAMGPFEAQDMSGLQIAEANRRRQDATRDPNERYVTISDSLCAMGRLGQRTGKGWYAYDPGNRAPRPDPEVQQVIEDYAMRAGITRRTFFETDIQQQLLAVLANEGARIVEEGIAESDAAVDMVQLHGYGFPRWRGGPMHMAAEQGDTAIRDTLVRLDVASPGSWTRAARYS